MHRRSVVSRSLLGIAIAASLALPVAAQADAIVSKDLQQRLDAYPTHRVIVTFSDRTQMSRLATLTNSLLPLKSLPMVGALLTSSQVRQVAQWSGVESVYFDAPLKYMNYEAGEITGGHKVHDYIGLRGKDGVIAIIDSGVDATHPDLKFGSKVIQNVKVVGDLGAAGGVTAYLEGQQTTDTSSGHGTHVAGTTGGTGAASATDPRRANYYAGIAPDSKIVGIGTGEGINILFSLQGFDYALTNQQKYGIDVITNSWGSSTSVYDPNNPVNKASYEAYKRGMVVTFAAGNDGPAENTINPYALVPWVIDVGSGTKSKDLSDFSSRGIAGDFYKHVDLIAPGSDIISTHALNTALPKLGPVLDLGNPTYNAYYAGMSGTSMATPFVAGAATLLLEANPDLSPDQIEEILVKTADPMNYPHHWVGGGYINVLAAVDLASKTTGQRRDFLKGITRWSSQGAWIISADNNSLLTYGGSWSGVADAGTTDGIYRKGTVSKKSVPRVNLAFQGSAAQLLYPQDAKGGQADVYVDGTYHGRIGFYNATTRARNSYPLTNLGAGLHTVELRGVTGNVYFDGMLTEGKLYPANVTISDTTTRFTGSLGPSVEQAMEVDEFPFEVDVNAITVKAVLAWDGGVDVDFALVDPDGNEVASGASLENPEVLEYAVTRPGTYKYRVKGFTTVLANYTLDSTITSARVVATP